jgi:hypothetical protein
MEEKMTRKSIAFWLLVFLPVLGWTAPNDCRYADTVFITNDDIVGTVTLDANNLYIIDGLVFVQNGEVLNIPAGTHFWAMPGEAENSSALICARGGKIYATGTATNPIIMSGFGDDFCDPYDIAENTRGLWGGLIILGRGKINTADMVGQIEGIDPGIAEGRYGDSTGYDDDNSGVYQYISIRHGGTNIGEANEINGLTMGAVGSGTTIDHIEVFNNNDDGFEWFGGTVNCKYLVSAFNDDDGFDYDESYRGLGQFWFNVFDSITGDKCGEHDGGTDPEDGLPYAIPNIFNVTYVGLGKLPGHALGKNSRIFAIRDNAGGHYNNSIFAYGAQKALDIEDLASPLQDSRKMLEDSLLSFNYCMWWNFGDWVDGTPGCGSGVGLESVNPQQWVKDYLWNNIGCSGTPYFSNSSGPTNSWGIDPMLAGMSWSDMGKQMDPRLLPGSPALTGPRQTIPADPFFTSADYIGAFGPYNANNYNNLWIKGWTHLWERGITPFICGDFNGDHANNLLDILAAIDFIYGNPKGSRPSPFAAGDVNAGGHGVINLLDILTMIDDIYSFPPAGDNVVCAF